MWQDWQLRAKSSFSSPSGAGDLNLISAAEVFNGYQWGKVHKESGIDGWNNTVLTGVPEPMRPAVDDEHRSRSCSTHLLLTRATLRAGAAGKGAHSRAPGFANTAAGTA